MTTTSVIAVTSSATNGTQLGAWLSRYNWAAVAPAAPRIEANSAQVTLTWPVSQVSQDTVAAAIQSIENSHALYSQPIDPGSPFYVAGYPWAVAYITHQVGGVTTTGLV